MFDFRIFSAIYVYIYWKYQPFWIVSVFLTNKKVSRVWVCSTIIKNETKCARIFEMLTVAFGESTISRTQGQLWYNWFKDGQEDVNDDAHPGCPSTLTTDEN